MSDCAAAPEIFIPNFGDMPQGVRFLLTVLRVWADARGSIDAGEDELAAYTGMGESTVRRHLAWAAANGREWVSRSERRRRGDGTLSGYRYWLRLEKFGAIADHRSNRAVAGTEDEAGSTVGAAVGNAVDGPPLNSSTTPLDPSKPPPNSSGGLPDLSGGECPENKGFEGSPRERARAFPFSSSSFLSFPWRDEAVRVKAGEILSVCGEKLGGLGEQNERVLHSLAYVLETGLWAEFDWTLDVLPVARVKTGPTQTRVLWDFALLSSNLARHRRLRLGGGAKATGATGPKAKRKVYEPPVVEASEARAKRMDALRREIAAIDRGEGQPFMLPNRERSLSGEWLADAYARVRAADAAELLRLEADAPMAKAEG